MPIRRAVKLVEKAVVETDKADLFKLYLADRPRMKKIISFNEYMSKIGYTKHLKYEMDTRSSEEIYDELKGIMSKFERKE